MLRIQKCWQAISSGHIFTDLTREESDQRCAVLEQQAIRTNIDTPEQQWINDLTRQHRFK